MGMQQIEERIILDAEAEAAAIIAAAEKKADEAVEAAKTRAERDRAGVEAEVRERVKAISDGKAASARLDSAKILLAEKRRVLDGVYAQALKKLVALDRDETLKLCKRLLEEYAEEGDEIVFASNFRYTADVCELSVIAEKGLTVSRKSGELSGGFMLRGKNADKDLTYGALLLSDREEHQAEIAAKLFG